MRALEGAAPDFLPDLGGHSLPRRHRELDRGGSEFVLGRFDVVVGRGPFAEFASLRGREPLGGPLGKEILRPFGPRAQESRLSVVRDSASEARTVFSPRRM